jgi:nitrate/nitrite transporter NarK
MGGLTPLVWLLFTSVFGMNWRAAFFIFGGIGSVWCVFFYLKFYDRPRQHPGVNDAEAEMIEAGRKDEGQAHANVPWKKLLGSANLWSLSLMYFCASYGWYFNITYLPDFLETQYGVGKDSTIGAVYKGGPLLFGAMTCLIGGLLSDRFVRRTGNLKWGRRLFGVVGHSLCALCYVACVARPSLVWFVLAISFAAFWNDLTMGAAWAACQDVGKRYAAIVAGCMNTIGNLGGAAAGAITPLIVKARIASAAGGDEIYRALSADEKRELLWPAYQTIFLIFGAVYVLAVLFWLRVDATKPVVPEQDQA